MAAGSLDITVEQGATYSLSLTFLDSDSAPVNVSTWEFRGQIRSAYDDSDIIAAFTFTAGSASNIVVVSLTDTVTSAIPVDASSGPKKKNKKYAYDIEAEKPDGSVVRVVQGVASVSPEVTKDE